MKTAVVIVMYNQWCGDAMTCATMEENTRKPDLILVVDNSTKDMKNEEYCQLKGWQYLSMGSNAGLSKAYNAALQVLKGQTDYVIWADDDTRFPADYFEKLAVYAEKHPDADLFLPVVKSQSVILSPAVYTQRIVYPVQELEQLEGKEITAINSGLVVSMSVYEDFSYDEAIFLDYVDHDLLCWCRENGKKLCIMKDVELLQSFFNESIPTRAARKHRLNIYKKDIRVFEAKHGKNRLLTEYDLLRHRYFEWRDLVRRIIRAKIKKNK